MNEKCLGRDGKLRSWHSMTVNPGGAGNTYEVENCTECGAQNNSVAMRKRRLPDEGFATLVQEAGTWLLAPPLGEARRRAGLLRKLIDENPEIRNEDREDSFVQGWGGNQMIRRVFHRLFGHGDNLLLAGWCNCGLDYDDNLHLPKRVFFYCPQCEGYVTLNRTGRRNFEVLKGLP